MAAPGRSDFDRMKRLLNGPRPMRKYIYCQLVTFLIFLYIWVSYNGGLVPWFLRHKVPMLKMGTDMDTLYYFSRAGDDGSHVKWAHGVNTEHDLKKAIDSKDVDMVEADVMLQGEGTSSQSLTPVMGMPPATSGTPYKFEDWLRLVAASGKGIKIDIQSTDSIEITLQTLKEHKEKLRAPVWIHANIFQGPLGKEAPVDKTRFIKHVKRLFPQCTLSLGWTTGTHTDLSQTGYTWNMVIDMYHFVHEHEIQPPLVFTMRASMIRNSVTQIKWLTDNTRSSVLIYNHPGDRPLSEDLMYIAYKFAPHNSYFDLQDQKMNAFVSEYRDRSSEKLNQLVLERDTVMFKPTAWVKMGLHIEKHSILPSDEALILTTKAVYIVTKTKYSPTPLISLNGRVQFLNRRKREAVRGETGLNIYIRPTVYNDFENIIGIRCFIGVDGLLEVMGSNLKNVKDFKKSSRITPGTANCFHFSVTDEGKEVVLRVSVLHHCDTLDSVKKDEQVHAELRVPIPRDLGNDKHPFILRLEDSNRYAVIDELHVKYRNKV